MSRSTDAMEMQTIAFDAFVSSLPADQTAASHVAQEATDGQREMLVAHVRYAAGDDHLRLQLQIGKDHKAFFRAATEKIEKLRRRLQIQAAQVAQAADGAAMPPNGSHPREQRNNPTTAQTSQFRVRFLTASHEEIVDTSVTVGDALMRTERMAIGETTYAVLHNQPTVASVAVIRPLLVGIPILPVPETEFCRPDECTWRWHRIDANGNASFLCDERRYVPTVDDLGVSFRIECRAPLMDSPFAVTSAAHVVTTPVVRGPDRSMFEERRALGRTHASDVFRVMTYNILFDGYASQSQQTTSDVFGYVTSHAMDEMYRMQLVFQEIQDANADVVCLQEVGATAFHTFFEPMMEPLGYHTLYTGKTGTTHEGCAVLIRKDAFEIEEEHTLVVSVEALHSEDTGLRALLSAFPELCKGLEKIPSIAQLLVLRDKRHPARHVVLANTHLYYREDADMIRVVQAIATVRAIERIQSALRTASGHPAAVVFCGDLNAVPDSATVHFLLDGVVDDSHRHWQELGDFRWVRDGTEQENTSDPVLDTEPPVSSGGGCIAHSLALSSACGIPEFTNFAGCFVATLDYILLGRRELEVAHVFPLFTREQVAKEVALPSTAFPSDHISLIADLQWRKEPLG